EQCEILFLLQCCFLSALEIELGHDAPGSKLGGRVHEAFCEFESLRLQIGLLSQARKFGFEAASQVTQPLGLGAAAVLLGIDLLANEIALQSERAQNGAIDVLAVSRDLLGRNGEERLSVLDFI